MNISHSGKIFNEFFFFHFSIFLEDRCQQPLLTGPDLCDAVVYTWWHNPATITCEHVEYGGCNVSENHFGSEAACKAACVNN